MSKPESKIAEESAEYFLQFSTDLHMINLIISSTIPMTAESYTKALRSFLIDIDKGEIDIGKILADKKCDNTH